MQHIPGVKVSAIDVAVERVRQLMVCNAALVEMFLSCITALACEGRRWLLSELFCNSVGTVSEQYLWQ